MMPPTEFNDLEIGLAVLEALDPNEELTPEELDLRAWRFGQLVEHGYEIEDAMDHRARGPRRPRAGARARRRARLFVRGSRFESCSERRQVRFHSSVSDVLAHVVETDAQLVARCRAGDDDAWRELVERFSRYVYAIAVQAFRLPEADAEDVFQEVFARAYENLPKLRDDSAIRPWLAQLTRRLCLDTIRAGAREQPGRAPGAVGRRRHDREPRRGARTSTRRSPRFRTTAARSSTASSPGTRATARSATRSTFPRARSRAASRAASSSSAIGARGKKSGLCGVWWLTTYA